ncbi:hypothetical protein [Bacillus sp. EB01]|uniref:hypothetical protein n=1 Tax=Bacillus sp. EB01 TaxID=1347086 RepID=UPI0012DCADEF|nr:hypothetical protein [Bacillus sp. EB01]
MLKNLRKRVSVSIMMLMSIFSLIGCNAIDKSQAAAVEELLEKKYNQEFVATAIGERYGTANNDTVTTILHPKGKEELVFEAVMNKDRELIADTYIPRLISDSINGILKNGLKTQGIESETNTVAMGSNSAGESNTKITIEEYVQSYKPKHFSGHMIVKEKAGLTSEQFEEVMREVYDAGNQTVFQVKIRVIAEDEYEKALRDFRKQPDITDSWFRDYNVVRNIVAVVDANGFNYMEKDARDGE